MFFKALRALKACQGPHFGPGDLAEIGVQLDQQERQLVSEASATEYNATAPKGLRNASLAF